MAKQTFNKQVVSVYNYGDDYSNIPTIVEDVNLVDKSLRAAKLQATKLAKKHGLVAMGSWIYNDFTNDYLRRYTKPNSSVDGIKHRIIIHHFQEDEDIVGTPEGPTTNNVEATTV